MDDVNLQLYLLDLPMFYHLARRNSHNKADLGFADWEAYKLYYIMSKKQNKYVDMS